MKKKYKKWFLLQGIQPPMATTTVYWETPNTMQEILSHKEAGDEKWECEDLKRYWNSVNVFFLRNIESGAIKLIAMWYAYHIEISNHEISGR